MTQKTPIYDCIIIGAGLTGLTTAYHLSQTHKHILLLEEKDRVGGQIQTHTSQGYIFESGPNTGTLSHPETAELFQSLANPDLLEIAQSQAKKRLILKDNQFHPLPYNLLSALTTPLFTFTDKLRILGEPFRAKRNIPNESIADLTLRRLGPSYLNYAVDPFISGIYAGDPHQMVTQYALPKLYQLEQQHGSFIRGAIAKRRTHVSPRQRLATKQVFSTHKGLQQLINTLQQKITNERIRLNIRDLQIHPTSQHWQVRFDINHQPHTLQAKYVVTTVPAYRLPALLPFIPPHHINPIAQLPYASVIQIAVGLPDHLPPALKAFGGLIPSIEHEDALGILFPYQCFRHRAPSGKALYSFFLGGIQRPDLLTKTDAQLRTIVEDLLRRTLGYRPLPPIELFHVFRHHQVIPQYDATTAQRLQQIQHLQNLHPHLIIAGNLRDGIGMSHRIAQATQIAHELAQKL